jgi:hypothetical protein
LSGVARGKHTVSRNWKFAATGGAGFTLAASITGGQHHWKVATAPRNPTMASASQPNPEKSHHAIAVAKRLI